MKLRIGSRGSQLALWQAKHVGELLNALGHSYEIVVIRTTGDRLQSVSFTEIGTKGMFTKEIEEALGTGEIDLAVHSMKDLPTELMPEFEIAATLPREDHRDALLSVRHSTIEELPANAHVGTSSLRREAQLRALRPDVRVSPLRGNVDTRIRKLESGEYEAILLAAAGVKRLSLEHRVREVLPECQFLPAAGQGALAVEVSARSESVREVVGALDDAQTATAIRCERALLRALGGGCQVPIGAYARVLESSVHLQALVARTDGSEIIRYEGEGRDAEALGQAVARELLSRGAERILKELDGTRVPIALEP